MASSDLRSIIIRILKDDEMSGYSIYKSLLMKGLKTWPNHVYTLLSDMEKDRGLLRSRWVVDRRRNNSTRRHLYSLSETGNQEYEGIVKDSVVVLMERRGSLSGAEGTSLASFVLEEYSSDMRTRCTLTVPNLEFFSHSEKTKWRIQFYWEFYCGFTSSRSSPGSEQSSSSSS